MESLDQQHKQQWREIAQMLAYTSFTGPAYDILSSRNFTHENIHKFNVTIYCSTYVNEEDSKDVVDITVRFSVFLARANVNSIEEITLGFNNKIILDALITKIYDPQYGVFQQYDFEFEAPNPIELFDGEFYLMNLLGLEII